MADDSGLQVSALGGAPDPQSARYAGRDATDQDRVGKLLEELVGVSEQHRRAEFVCAIALVVKDGEMMEFIGRCPGRILDAPRGSGGFGYDPLFVPDGEDRTFAEMSLEEKRQLSHRGRALAHLRRFLEGPGGTI